MPNLILDKEFNEDLPSQTAVSSKIKAVRSKYRKAVNEGRRSGNGRVVALHYDLLNEIWAGNPATEPLAGIETGVTDDNQDTEDGEDGEVSAGTEAPTPTSAATEPPTPTSTRTPTPTGDLANRRALLNDTLLNHKTNKLKRKLSADQISQNAQKEDVELKKRMVAQMESFNKTADDQFKTLTSSLDRIAQCMEAFTRQPAANLPPNPLPNPLPNPPLPPATQPVAAQNHMYSNITPAGPAFQTHPLPQHFPQQFNQQPFPLQPFPQLPNHQQRNEEDLTYHNMG